MTKYVVLRRTKGAIEGAQTATFEMVNDDPFEAPNAGKACDIAADGLADLLADGLELVAVPARSWKYTTIREETTRRRVRA